jgi:hypothetical protein
LFLPALYVAWFRIKEPQQSDCHTESFPQLSPVGIHEPIGVTE